MANHSWLRILGLTTLAFALMLVGTWACSGTQEDITGEEQAVETDNLVYEGEIKVAYGKYAYIPEAQGFDVLVEGALESGDLVSLIGRQVKVEGNYIDEHPSVLVVDTLSVKEDDGTYRSVFTRTQDAALEDYIDLSQRDEFPLLEGLAYNKNDVWEGQETAKVYGSLEEAEEGSKISVFDEEGKTIGSVLIDNYTDFAHYYLKKLNLFEKYWFYLQIKDTVEWRTRRRTREMFHADLLFVGLY